MSKVFSAHAVSVDGYITGRDPGAGRGLGDGDACSSTGTSTATRPARCSTGSG